MFAAHLARSTNVPVILLDRLVEHANSGGAFTSFTLGSSGGVFEAIGGGGDSYLYNWTSGTPANFEARATLSSGAVNGGTFGSWLALSSARTWSNTASAGSSSFGDFLLEIRDVATSTVRASANISLESDAL